MFCIKHRAIFHVKKIIYDYKEPKMNVWVWPPEEAKGLRSIPEQEAKHPLFSFNGAIQQMNGFEKCNQKPLII